MSEYQYYEFQAIDRPLSEADRQALRQLSTRAQITATSFKNEYNWSDFKGDPAKLMASWFDLHLYLANWGSHRLMIRLPKRLVDRPRLDAFLKKTDHAKLTVAGDNLILDITRDEIRGEHDDWDGSGWLASLAPLRAEVLSGDLRLFYLIWLMGVEEDAFTDDEVEPMPGIGPITATLEAFARFFAIDYDLVQAAGERAADVLSSTASTADVRRIIAAMADGEKTEMLTRLLDNDPHVAAKLRTKVRNQMASRTGATPPAKARTVGELRARAQAIGAARTQAAAKQRAAEQKRQAAAAEKARQARLVAVAQRGESVWQEIETEVERRNAPGYDKAAELLADLQAIAGKLGTTEEFLRRLRAIRERHAQKKRLIERLAALG